MCLARHHFQTTHYLLQTSKGGRKFKKNMTAKFCKDDLKNSKNYCKICKRDCKIKKLTAKLINVTVKLKN